MLWLSLRLALQGGREAIIRLVLTAVAVMIGVAVLLAVLTQLHAFQTTSQRPCWECTTSKTQQASTSLPSMSWLYRKDAFKGMDIKRLDVAALDAKAPLLPGLTRLPANGEYYASPALAKLIKATPRDELGGRFPGSQVGTLGDEALSSPDALVIVIGRTKADLAVSSATITVNTIAKAPKQQAITNFLRFALGIGAAGLLFPILMLIGAATRLSSARREERYAALRLVGATPRQINIIASVDAVAAAILGTLFGIGLFLLLQPMIADAALMGSRFFAKDVTPTTVGYIAVLLGVPLAAAVAALLSLRQVRISPLGVSRRATPAAPGAWRILPLVAGLVLFVAATALVGNKNPTATAAIPGLVLTMIGLLVAGPWITAGAARLMAKLAHSAPSLLAARRLADSPGVMFRAVSGLVLAVFIGTVVASMAPALLSRESKVKTDALSNVMTAGFFSTGDLECDDECAAPQDMEEGLSATAGAKLIAQLKAFDGVSVYPIYVYPPVGPAASPGGAANRAPAGQRPQNQEPSGPGAEGMAGPNVEAMRCDDIVQLAVLGSCPAGAQAVTVSASDPVILNHQTDAIVSSSSATVALSELTNRALRAVFVRVDKASSLEKVRTLLAVTTTSASSEVPRTFGEIRQDKLDTAVDVQRIIFIALGMTLLVAGCSLAVAVGGSLVERRRPFTLLRLSGVPLSALYKIVLWEAVVPLLAATLIAAGVGFGLSAVTVAVFAPEGVTFHIQSPSLAYYLTVVGSLVVALLVVCSTLPLLARITSPDKARFE